MQAKVRQSTAPSRIDCSLRGVLSLAILDEMRVASTRSFGSHIPLADVNERTQLRMLALRRWRARCTTPRLVRGDGPEAVTDLQMRQFLGIRCRRADPSDVSDEEWALVAP